MRFVKKAVTAEIQGKSENFQIVPGCGLKTTVSHIETMLNTADQSQELRNCRNAMLSGR